MKIKIPFTEKSVVKDIGDKPMRLGYRRVGHHKVSKLSDFTLDKYEIIDGVLYLLDDRDSITHTVTAIEVENNSLFLSGEVMGAHGKDGAVRMMMYEKKELGEDFLVIVSSHVDYEEKALPRLIRSLAREGIPKDRIIVVVSGAEGESDQKEDYIRVPIKDNYFGCTALSALLNDIDMGTFDYAMLLHDTCEVNSGFAEKVSKIDVGIPYDMISAQREIGLWSKSFLNRIRSMQGFKLASGYKVYDSLMDLCRLSCDYSSTLHLRSKDVYGTGVKRQVLELVDFGIKKYSGRDMTGGRP